MNKLKYLIAFVALLVVLVSLAACGKKPQGENTQVPDHTDGSVSDTQPTENTTEPTTQDENADSGTSVVPGRPDISYDTEIGTREEGDGSKPNTADPTTPTEKPTEPTTPSDTGLNMNYQQYMAMSGGDQQLFYNKHFADDPLGFASWFQKIKKEYEDGKVEIEATGPIDIEDYIKP